MTTELFDTHCHLTSPELYARRGDILASAAAAGVTQLITIACRPEEFGAALEMRSLSPRLYVSGGIHPHEAARIRESDWGDLGAVWTQDRVVAAGEMGLDYHYDFSPQDVQRQVFGRQLRMASGTRLPLVIHCREAQADTIDLLLAAGFARRPVVFHCFSGTPDEAAELRSHGWRTSFTGLITFKNCGPQRQACLETPLNELMFETDSPYLSPEPVRRVRPNEPAFVAHTIRFAAQLFGISFEEMADRSTANAREFFRINEAG